MTSRAHLLALVGGLLLGGTLVAPSLAHATPPPQVPVQGVLSDADGVPLSETLDVVFTMYVDDAGSTIAWSETQSVSFEDGFFSVYLGESSPADAELFRDNQALWLGIAVDGDVEMNLIPIATAPFAAFAAYAGEAATLEGMAAADFAPIDHRTDWTTIDNIPAELSDGDSDTTYGAMAEGGIELGADNMFSLFTGCATDEVLKRTDTGWACAPDAIGDVNDATITSVTLSGTLLEIMEGANSTTIDLVALADDGDADATNELNSAVTLTGTTLEITDAGGTISVDLASLGDDADADPTNELIREALLSGTTLQITDAGGTLSVDLASLGDDADADPTNELITGASFSGTTLSITDAGGTTNVDLASLGDDADADPTNELITGVSLSGMTLNITDAGGTSSVNLTSLGNDADADPSNEFNTGATLSGSTLNIIDGGGTQSVNLAALINDADADPTNEYNTGMSLSGGTLNITDGGGTQSVSLAALVDDADADPSNEFNTGASLSGTTLTITDGGGSVTVDLASIDTDTDTDTTYSAGSGLQLSGTTFSVSTGGITTSHIADQTINEGDMNLQGMGTVSSTTGELMFSRYMGTTNINGVTSGRVMIVTGSTYGRGLDTGGSGTATVKCGTTTIATISVSGSGARPWTYITPSFSLASCSSLDVTIAASSASSPVIVREISFLPGL